MSAVIGFHVIGCTYGFWLPNDERGSGSDFVRSAALVKFGPANPVGHRRSVARRYPAGGTMKGYFCSGSPDRRRLLLT